MGSAVCQSCGAEIIWRVTTDGRRVPIDPVAHAEGVVRMLPAPASGYPRCQFLSKVNAAAAREAGERLWMPHHATCESVERHRVPRAQMAMDL